jgi:RNA polymerase sigma factor (sigma-70 family)
LDQETARSDADLLKQFIEQRDESAFATLVRRHGAMVLGVCRRVVQNPHDAEDAFQATFLILVRKAAALARRELLANWLHGVAYHTALKARAAAMKRRARERQVTAVPEVAAREVDLWSTELRALLDQELGRLPEKYRVAVILCDLEGKTRKAAARLLGCPEGSLSSRLARARALLAKRLARRGWAVAPGRLGLGAARRRCLDDPVRRIPWGRPRGGERDSPANHCSHGRGAERHVADQTEGRDAHPGGRVLSPDGNGLGLPGLPSRPLRGHDAGPATSAGEGCNG